MGLFQPSSGKTDEEIRDVVVALLSGGANIGLTHDDPGDDLSIAVSPQGAGGGLNADQLDGSEANALGGALTLIERLTASGVASLDFTTGIDADHDVYRLVLANLVPATDDVQLLLRTSTDGGATWDSGAADYGYVGIVGHDGSSFSHERVRSTGDSSLPISHDNPGVGSAAGENGVSGYIEVSRPSEAARLLVHGSLVWVDSNGEPNSWTFTGERSAEADVDGLRLLFSGGNIESGVAALYGFDTS